MCLKVLLPKFMHNRVQKLTNSGVFASELDTHVKFDMPLEGTPAIVHIIARHNERDFESEFPSYPSHIYYPTWEPLARLTNRISDEDVFNFKQAMLKDTSVARGYWGTREWTRCAIIPSVENVEEVMEMVTEGEWMVVGDHQPIHVTNHAGNITQNGKGINVLLCSTTSYQEYEHITTFHVGDHTGNSKWGVWVRNSPTGMYNGMIVGYFRIGRNVLFFPIIASTNRFDNDVDIYNIPEFPDTFHGMLEMVEYMEEKNV